MKRILLLLLIAAVSFTGCQLYETFVNISRLKFKLGEVNQVAVKGINLSGKNSIDDFSPLDMISVLAGVAGGSLPVSFVVNVDALNPNDGKGGYPRTDATIKRFPFRLMLDQKEVFSGDINEQFIIPGTGETTVLPLKIEFDLMKVFKDKSYESLLQLALNLTGHSSKKVSMEVYARPSVVTEIGELSYPGELKIVDMDFTKE
ncbi:hypothetical protein MTYM_01095 [Methylococcales bacterium]|nr:hypothetical protein MTYM_01095 [Methylococcales bacterium]